MMKAAAVGPGDRPAAVTGTMVGRYMLGRVVGKGLSSEVRLATNMDDDRLVALKILQKEWIWKNDMSALVRREIEIMKELDHPSVVKLIEVFNSDTHVFMAMEAVDGRELYEEINLKGMLEERRASDLFLQLMVAVDYIHSLGVAHRDLKLENLLLSRDGTRIKVTDFGLAARLDEWEGDPRHHQKRRSWGAKRKQQRRQQTACGTPSYAAPEIIASSETQGYDARGVDIWCAGVVLYAMVTGKMPFRGENVNATLDIIRSKEPTYPKQLSPEITNLLRSMLQKDPSKRMSVAGVLAHPWTTLSPQQPLSSSKKLESLLGASVSSREAASSTEQEDLAAAARDAIETAKQAASAAEKAAVAAQEAETTAAAALAAAADAAASRSSSPAFARGAKGESIRGIGGGGGDARPLSSPRGGLIPEWGQKITRLFGRQSSSGGVAGAKEVEADRAAAPARLPSVAASRRALLKHSATVGPRDRAWSGETDHSVRAAEDPGASRSASMCAPLAGRQFAPSHSYGMGEGRQSRDGELHFPAGGIFATTKASVGSATVAARRKLLRRSSTSTDKLAASMLHSGSTLVAPASAVGATTAPPGHESGETMSKASPPGGGGGERENSSVRARAHRASVNFALLSSMVKEYREGEAERTRQSSARPTIEPSLSSAFAATSTACDTTAADAALENDGSAPATLVVAEMVTAASSPPSSAGGTDSSSRNQGVASLSERDAAFDVVAGPAAAAAVSPLVVVSSLPAVEATTVDESLEKSAPTTAEQSIPPSLSTATTMSASPSLEDAAAIAASDHHQATPPQQQEGQDGRPSSPVTSAVSLQDALPPGGLELPKPSKSPRPSSGETSAETLAKRSAGNSAESSAEKSGVTLTVTSAENSAETSLEASAETPAEKSAEISAEAPAEQSAGHGSSESPSQATETSSELSSAGLSTNASAGVSKAHAPEPSVDQSAEAVTTKSSVGLVVEPPAVEGSAEPAPGPEGGLPVGKPTGLPTEGPMECSAEVPAELPAQSSPPTREVEILADGRTPETVEKPEGNTAADAATNTAASTTTAESTPTDAVSVEASTETPVEKQQPVKKPRTVTSAAAAAAAVAAATAVGVVAAAAASAVATAAVAITSPGEDKTAEAAMETAAGPLAAKPAAADPLVEQSTEASDKVLSKRNRAMVSQLPSESDEDAASKSEENIAKNLGADASEATSGTAMPSPGPDDTITANMELLSPVPTLVLKHLVSDKKREVSPGRETPQGRASSPRGRPLPSRSTRSPRVSPRGRSSRGRGRSLSPKPKSKSAMQSRSQEGSSRARSTSRSREASSPLRSMAQSDEAASPSPLPAAAAASTPTSENSSIVMQSSTPVSAAADQQAAGDDRATVAEAGVVVMAAVAGGVTATAGADPADAESANKKTGKDAWRWSSKGVEGGMEEDEKTETVASSDSSTANNLRERSGGEENIWVSAVDNGDTVRHRRASGRYRRGAQHRPSAGSGEAAPSNQVPAPSSGPSAEASGGVIAAAVAARSRVEAAKAAASASAAVPAPAGRGPPLVTVEAKKARKRGKSISRTVARIFGRRERTVTVSRGDGGVGQGQGQGLASAKSS